jgi:hypothetical protein
MLEHAFGYYGSAAFVAFYFSDVGDELAWLDSTGSSTVGGYWEAWQAFTLHPVMRAYLDPFDFGSSDRTATHWLLLDRQNRRFYVGVAGKVNALLTSKHRSPADILREMTGTVNDSLISRQITQLNKAIDEWDAKAELQKNGVSAMERQDYVMNAMIGWLNRIANPGENP